MPLLIYEEPSLIMAQSDMLGEKVLVQAIVSKLNMKTSAHIIRKQLIDGTLYIITIWNF